MSRQNLVLLLLSFSLGQSSVVVSVFEDVQHCFREDVETCLVGHAVEAMVDAAGLQRVVNSSESDGTSHGRSDVESIEERLAVKLADELGMNQAADGSRARGSALRTFNRAWKYLIPLMMGVMLKLATFLPIVLVVLSMIAKSAFVSGNMALLLTGLNFALKYWYPKWAAQHGQSTTEYSGNFNSGSFNGHEAFGHPNQLPHSYASFGQGEKNHGKITSVEYSRMF